MRYDIILVLGVDPVCFVLKNECTLKCLFFIGIIEELAQIRSSSLIPMMGEPADTIGQNFRKEVADMLSLNKAVITNENLFTWLDPLNKRGLYLSFSGRRLLKKYRVLKLRPPVNYSRFNPDYCAQFLEYPLNERTWETPQRTIREIRTGNKDKDTCCINEFAAFFKTGELLFITPNYGDEIVIFGKEIREYVDFNIFADAVDANPDPFLLNPKMENLQAIVQYRTTFLFDYSDFGLQKVYDLFTAFACRVSPKDFDLVQHRKTRSDFNKLRDY